MDFCILKQPCISRMKPVCFWWMMVLMCSWTQFSRNFWVCLNQYSWAKLFSFFVVSLCVLGIKVTVASWNKWSGGACREVLAVLGDVMAQTAVAAGYALIQMLIIPVSKLVSKLHLLFPASPIFPYVSWEEERSQPSCSSSSWAEAWEVQLGGCSEPRL